MLPVSMDTFMALANLVNAQTRELGNLQDRIKVLEDALLKSNKPKEINDREREMGRSETYYGLSPEAQWQEDKALGILDWDGK